MSYDVSSLWDMSRECGLVIEAPRLNPFDRAKKQFLWTLELNTPELRDQFFALDDRARWQAVNLPRRRAPPPMATRRRFTLNSDDDYDLNTHATAVRDRRPPAQVRDVWDAADGTATGREIFTKIGRSEDFNSVYKARTMLTSAEFPHLIVTPPRSGGSGGS